MGKQTLLIVNPGSASSQQHLEDKLKNGYTVISATPIISAGGYTKSIYYILQLPKNQ